MLSKSKSLLRRLLKTLAYTLFALLAFISIYLLAAYALARVPVNAGAAPGNDVTLYLLSNGVHTDVVLPLRTPEFDWTPYLRFEHTRGGDTTARYVALGWGDKNFYLNTPTWADLTAATAFKAATGLSSAAVHATFYGQLQESETCVKIPVGRDDYRRLVDFVRQSLRQSADGQLVHIPTPAIYGQNDAFYEAHGRYSLLHTCNTWTNNALKSAGRKACWWTPFGSGIFYHYR